MSKVRVLDGNYESGGVPGTKVEDEVIEVLDPSKTSNELEEGFE